jgi:hypothetical protein
VTCQEEAAAQEVIRFRGIDLPDEIGRVVGHSGVEEDYLSPPRVEEAIRLEQSVTQLFVVQDGPSGKILLKGQVGEGQVFAIGQKTGAPLHPVQELSSPLRRLAQGGEGFGNQFLHFPAREEADASFVEVVANPAHQGFLLGQG